MKALIEVASLLSNRRQLVWEMAKREVFERYSGQILGPAWAIGHPLIVMAVYLFVFRFVFRMNVGGTAEMPLDYSVYLLSGLIPWMTVQEVASKTTVAVSAQASLVKQAVFPSELLPVKSVLASLFTQLVATLALIVYVLIKYRSLPWTYALAPVLLGLQVCWLVGLGLALSALGVFVRDLKDVVQVSTVIGLYLVPVFYLPTMVPAVFRPLLYLNPFSYLIWCYQDVYYFGRFEHPSAWIVLLIFGAGAAVGGVRVFAVLKPAFGNVL